MNAVLLISLVWATVDTSLDAETRVGDLLQNPSRFDGRTLVLRGTLTRLQMHTSRKGDRYHTFRLLDDAKEILVLMDGRPTCKTGTMVTVRGRFEHASNRVDATVVTCVVGSSSPIGHPNRSPPCKRVPTPENPTASAPSPDRPSRSREASVDTLRRASAAARRRNVKDSADFAPAPIADDHGPRRARHASGWPAGSA
jgi:hypothetical protein